jgi:hypothetical protein
MSESSGPSNNWGRVGVTAFRVVVVIILSLMLVRLETIYTALVANAG